MSVASSPTSLRIPDGPSVFVDAGIPFSASESVTPPITAVVQTSLRLLLFIPSPRESAASSSFVSCEMNSSIVFLPKYTSRSLIPTSPVYLSSRIEFRVALMRAQISYERIGTRSRTKLYRMGLSVPSAIIFSPGFIL